MLNCKKRTDSITRHYFTNENKYLLSSWINEVGESLKDDLENDNLNNFVFMAPLEDGSIISISTVSDQLKVFHHNGSVEGEVILADDQYRRNNMATLKAFASRIKDKRIGLGYPFPFVFKNIIKSLRAEEIITFDNGSSFLCTENNNGVIALRKVCGNITAGVQISSLFSIAKSFDVAMSDAEMQNLYSKVKSLSTDSIKCRKFPLSDVRNVIKSLEDKVDKNSERRYDFGPIILKYKKAVMSGNKWLNEDGQVVSKEQVENILAWMYSAPVIIEYKRQEPSLEKEYNDNLFDEHLEQLFKECRFENAIRDISTYCLKENGDLEFIIKSYVKEEDDFIATGFQFVCAENGIIIRRAYFEDNDLGNRMESLKKVPTRIFTDFCEEKFMDNYYIVKNKKRKVLMKGLPDLE